MTQPELQDRYALFLPVLFISLASSSITMSTMSASAGTPFGEVKNPPIWCASPLRQTICWLVVCLIYWALLLHQLGGGEGVLNLLFLSFHQPRAEVSIPQVTLSLLSRQGAAPAACSRWRRTGDLNATPRRLGFSRPSRHACPVHSPRKAG